MKRYLITLLATVLMADVACASDLADNLPLQIASLDKTTSFTGYKSDLLDKKMLNKAMEESLRALTWDDRQFRQLSNSKRPSKKSPAKLGGKE